MTAELWVERRGPVAILTLNRPDSLNAFTHDLRMQLMRALADVEKDESVGAIVLTGNGRGFSAGAELKGEIISGAEVERVLNDEYGPSLRAIVSMPKPVIAAVNGFASGIGGSFALACDLMVMGEQAFLQIPFAKLGLIPDGGSTCLLRERIGHRRAFELAMSGERLPAARCVEWGLANRAVPDERVLEEAVAWATLLCDAAPLAVRHTKQLLRGIQAGDFEAALREEARLQAICIDSKDFNEGVTAFREKRTPKFTGR